MYSLDKKDKGINVGVVPTTVNDLKAHEIKYMSVFPDDQPSRVNAVGYIDPNKRIKQMIEAGIRIDAWNQALYDYENGDDQDDGLEYAEDREDWDYLESLTEGARQKELYEREMYKYYMNALKSQNVAQEASQMPPEANVVKSETSTPEAPAAGS